MTSRQVIDDLGRADTKSRAMPRMSRTLRRTVLIVHVISSVGWLGLTINNLVLAVAVSTTDSPVIQHAAWRILGLVGGVLLVPISWTAYVTGVVLGLGTTWGLVRYRWVVVKLCLTTIALVLTPLSLLPGIRDAVDIVSGSAPGQLADTAEAATGLLFAACVSLSMYTTCVILSIAKPWGRTSYGRTVLQRHSSR